jgi:hypothetical protein
MKVTGVVWSVETDLGEIVTTELIQNTLSHFLKAAITT